MSKSPVTIFWFRRDLRLHDNAGLYHALQGGENVLPLFIYDTEILEKLEDRRDRRVLFISQALAELKKQLEQAGSSIQVRHGKPEDVWRRLLEEYTVTAVYANEDYEPYAVMRDQRIRKMLENSGIPFHTCKDQCIFGKDEILKDDGTPYTVFTPYKNKWQKSYLHRPPGIYPSEKHFRNFRKTPPLELPALEDTGFESFPFEFPPPFLNENVIRHYAENRNFPSVEGTSRLSIHLRFGTISIREVAARAAEWSEAWLSELIWRDFYMMILAQFPYVTEGPFKKVYSNIAWRNNEEEFERWCGGMTGYPIVDAGMRELNATGFMHNRLRMITASFLSKHLLIDWRWGEAYFAKKLNDFELSSNNGGWQWAAGTGCDAAPYFRIFNPYEQARKFDPQMHYIKKWVPEAGTEAYPGPVVEHVFARERCLQVYKKALSS